MIAANRKAGIHSHKNRCGCPFYVMGAALSSDTADARMKKSGLTQKGEDEVEIEHALYTAMRFNFLYVDRYV